MECNHDTILDEKNTKVEKKIRDNMWDRGPDPTPKDFMYMKNEPEKREKKW